MSTITPWEERQNADDWRRLMSDYMEEEIAELREALKESGLKYVSLFGELQEANDQLDQLRAKLEQIEKQKAIGRLIGHKTIQFFNKAAVYPEGLALYALPPSPVNAELVEHYEAALKAAFPSGARGYAFDHWNKARAILFNAQAAKPALTQEQLKKVLDVLEPHHEDLLHWNQPRILTDAVGEAIEIVKGAL